MNSRKTKKKDSERAPRRARPEPFEIADAGTTEEMMALNGPRVLQWALKTAQKAARGRANQFEQKIALLLINKFTPSSGKRKGEDGEDVPEGTTKEEFAALNRLIQEGKKDSGGSAPPPARTDASALRGNASYSPPRPTEEG